MKKLTILFAAIGATLFTFVAYADSTPRLYSSGRIDFSVSLDYFKTTANFASDGSKTSLPGSNQFQNFESVLGLRYVLIDDLAVYSEVGIGNSESKDTIATRANSAISFVSLGADYRIWQSDAWAFAGTFSYSQAIEKINATADTALINDGANEIKAFLHGSYDWGFLVPFAKVGVNYRTEGLSTLFLYTVGTEIRFDSVNFGASLNGLMSVKDDDKTNRPLDRDLITNQVNAGSKRYYSINPNLTDSEIYLKFNLDQDWTVKATAGYTLLGSNSAEGFHLGAVLNWGFGGHSRKYSPSRSSSKKSEVRNSNKKLVTDPTDQTFKEDTNDGVNQDYFKPVAPSKSDYIEQIEGSSENLQNTTSPDEEMAPVKIKMKPKPVGNPTVEKEYKIKIRKKKKKKSS